MNIKFTNILPVGRADPSNFIQICDIPKTTDDIIEITVETILNSSLLIIMLN